MSDQELNPCPNKQCEYNNACSSECYSCGYGDYMTKLTCTPDLMLEELAGALEEIARCLSHGLQDCRASIIAKDMLGKYQQSKVEP